MDQNRFPLFQTLNDCFWFIFTATWKKAMKPSTPVFAALTVPEITIIRLLMGNLQNILKINLQFQALRSAPFFYFGQGIIKQPVALVNEICNKISDKLRLQNHKMSLPLNVELINILTILDLLPYFGRNLCPLSTSLLSLSLSLISGKVILFPTAGNRHLMFQQSIIFSRKCVLISCNSAK